MFAGWGGRRVLIAAVVACVALGATGISVALAAPGDVTTAAYNNLRDGWDPNEPGLGPSTLRSPGFQKVFSTKLAGSIYAQPLVYEGTLIATTEKARAYGLDPATGAIRWQRSFGTAFKSSTIGCTDLKPNLGSTSTPVIDPSTGTLYMTTRLVTGHKGGKLANAHWFLQALSTSTGEERPGFPVPIQGTPYNTPEIAFNEAFQEQRPGLLLLEGVVYVAFASDCDINPYRGIVAGFSAANGEMTTMWSDESGPAADEGSMAGVWQSGAGLVSDIPGRIIMTTGNGVSPTRAASDEPPQTLSESVVGLTVGAHGQIAASQFFAPSDAPTLDQNDEDFGSGGPMALPSEFFGTPSVPHLVIQVGKDGRVFLLNADDMGGYLQGPGESGRSAADTRSLRRRVGTPRGLRWRGRMGLHPRERRRRQPRGLRHGRRSARRTAAGPRRTERRIVRLRLRLADRHQRWHHRRQRRRVGDLRGRTGQRRPAARLRRDPRRRNAAAAVVGLDRDRLEVLRSDRLRRARLRRHPQRQAPGLRQLLQRAPPGRPGRNWGPSPSATPAASGCRSRPPARCGSRRRSRPPAWNR